MTTAVVEVGAQNLPVEREHALLDLADGAIYQAELLAISGAPALSEVCLRFVLGIALHLYPSEAARRVETRARIMRPDVLAARARELSKHQERQESRRAYNTAYVRERRRRLARMNATDPR